MPKYKAVAVLCGGLRKEGDEFLPATYEQSDEFGMLGGHIRVAAAVGIQLMGQCSEFLFSGGVSAKAKDVFGPSVPAEAGVYRDAFLEEFGAYARHGTYQFLPGARKKPVTVLGLNAYNTRSNVQEAIDAAAQQGWTEVALLTNSYHVPRARAWSEKKLVQHNNDTPGSLTMNVLSAEDVVLQTFPGVYDGTIKAAYESEAGILRIKHEAQGVEDLRRGQQVTGEFQLQRTPGIYIQ